MGVDRANQIARWLFPAMAFLLPVFGSVVPRGVAPLAGVVGLAAAWLLVVDGGRRWIPHGPPAMLFVFLVAFATLSAIWALDPVASLTKVPSLALMACAGGLVIAAAPRLDEVGRRRMGLALAVGLSIALLPPLADRVLGGAISGNEPWVHNRGLNIVALLIWPASLLLRGRRNATIALWAAAAVVVFALESESAKAALVFALVAAGLDWYRPRLAPVLIAVTAIVYIAAAPTLHGRVVTPRADGATWESVSRDWPQLPRSAYHRLLIWEFAANRIAEKPLLGWGFDGARRLPGGKERLDIPEHALPLHPHNAVLQLWVELGAVGAALAAALIVWVAMRIRRIADRAAASSATGYFAAALTMLCVAYGVWQSWWLAALFLSASLLAAALPRDS